jgi:hypothetical protein
MIFTKFDIRNVYRFLLEHFKFSFHRTTKRYLTLLESVMIC